MREEKGEGEEGKEKEKEIGNVIVDFPYFPHVRLQNPCPRTRSLSLSLSFLLLPYAASQALNREHDTSSRKLNVAQRTTGRDIAISSSYMARRLCKLSRSVCSSILWNARLGRTRVESIHHLCFDSRVRQIFWGGGTIFSREFFPFFFSFLSFFFFRRRRKRRIDRRASSLAVTVKLIHREESESTAFSRIALVT